MYNGGIVAGTLLLGDRIGIFAAAIGAIVGALLHLAIRLIGIARTAFRPRPTLTLRVRGVREFLLLMAPKMLSHPIEPLTFLYFTSLASRFDVGSVSSVRSEEHTSELQSHSDLVCRLLLEKKKHIQSMQYCRCVR